MAYVNTDATRESALTLVKTIDHAQDLLTTLETLYGQRHQTANATLRANAYKGEMAARLRAELPQVAESFEQASKALSVALRAVSTGALEELGE